MPEITSGLSRHTMGTLLALIAGLVGISELHARSLLSENPDWMFSAHIQMRSEFDGRDFDSDTDIFGFTSLRTRLGVARSINSRVHMFVQIQDARLLGSAPNTLANLANLDLHQAILQIDSIFNMPLILQLGRMEYSYGSQRFLGAVGWHFVGRSFDGARIILHQPDWSLDVFSTILRENDPYIGNANRVALTGRAIGDLTLHGFWGDITLAEGHAAALFGLLEIDDLENAGGDVLLSRITTGLNYNATLGDFNLLFEGAYQLGRQAVSVESDQSIDIAAYLASLSANYSLGEVSLHAQADVLSGSDLTDASGDFGALAVPFGTNHKFYGIMDYFINLLVNTGRAGLNDFSAGVSWNPDGSAFSAKVIGHHMMSNQTIISLDGTEVGDTFGQEVDLLLHYAIAPATKLTLGGGMFLPDTGMEAIFGLAESDPGLWAFCMLTAGL